MSDHRNDTLDRDLAGASSVTLEEAKSMLRRRWQSDGELRLPERPDEQGALLVRIPLFSTERIAYFAHGERARLVFLDRRAQPSVHAPAKSLPSGPSERQSAAPRSRPSVDAGPLFGGTPGCAAPLCDPARSEVIPGDPPRSQELPGDPARSQELPGDPARSLKLICRKCGKPPPAGVQALEGGTHWLIRSRNDASRGYDLFVRTQKCGTWRRA